MEQKNMVKNVKLWAYYTSSIDWGKNTCQKLIFLRENQHSINQEGVQSIKICQKLLIWPIWLTFNVIYDVSVDQEIGLIDRAMRQATCG